MTAAAPRSRWNVGRVGVGLGVALGLAGIGFASGGYFPTAWGWGTLIALTVVVGFLVVGTATRPSKLALLALGGIAAFGAWTWLALLWTDDRPATVLEGQRVLLYAAALAALVLLVRAPAATPVLGATLVALFLAAGYGLLTRLFPERLGVFDPVAAYRLEEPLTYWNALGIFAAFGALLALGFAARAQHLAARVAAGAALPIFLATVYFTFSRGAWIAGALGLTLAVAVDPRRLELLLTAIVVAPACVVAVLVSSRQDALTRTDVAEVADASREGHRLAVYLLVLMALAALAAGGLALAQRRVAPGRQARLAFGGALGLAAVVSLLAVFVRYGDPVTLARKGYDSFTTTPARTPVNLNRRLFTFSGSYRSELWQVAWDDYEDNPLLGSGPGTYEGYWNEHRPIRHKVRDAHNLYLEVLAELGPVGLVLLLIALGAPLAAGLAARAHPFVPAALAAYAAFLVHAAVDWDWEMAAVTLAGLTCGAVLLAAADRRDAPPPLSSGWRIGAAGTAAVLAAVAFVGLVGASALAASERALEKGRYGEARSQARKATRWWRWSPEPWQQLGDVQAEQGDVAGARASYRKAISKDRSDWETWYALAAVTTGPQSERALAETRRLNPFYDSDFEGGNAPR